VALRTVGARLLLDITQYTSNLKRAGAATKDFTGELARSAKAGNLDAVADRAGVAGIALTGLAGYAVKAAADFDKSMSAVSAATHASSKDIEALRNAALQAGKDTQFSATQAADGITELSKAGVSTADVLNGGLKGALSLAAAGQLSVGEAAETAASAMTQFKLKGDQVPHVADLLAAAAGKAQGSVHDMGFALNQSGLVASQFGLSIEDTTGALAEFANAGLIGSDAGTSLKTMLLAIANPATQTRELMNDLGISFYDATGKFIGMSGVAQVLQTRLKGLTDAERQQALGQIFGNDAIRAASILYQDGAAGVQKWAAAVNDSGYASETASKLTDNLAGDIERLRGSIETLAIESGSGANSGLRILAKGLNDVVNQIGGINPAVGSTLTVLAALGGALLLGLAAWIKYRKVVAEAQEQLIATGPAGEKAAAGLGRVTSALGKVAIWAAAAESATLLFNALDDKSADVDKLAASLDNLAKTGKATGELHDVFGDDWDKLGRIATFANSASDGVGKFINKAKGMVPVLGDAGVAAGNFATRLFAGTDLDSATQQMQSLDTALTNYIETTNDSRKASDLWNQVLSKSGLNTEQLAKLLPNTWKQLATLNAQAGVSGEKVSALGAAAGSAAGKTGDLTSALDVGADAQNKYKTQTDAAAGAARGERAALGALYSQLKAQTDPVFALIDSQQKLKQAQDTAAKAIKEHGRNSSQARAADLELAKAALDLQNSVGNLSTTFNGRLSPSMIQTLRNAHLTEAQIKDVGKQFEAAKKSADKYAGSYEAKASAPGAKQAKKDLDLAYTSANGFAGPYIANVKVTGQGKVEAELRKLSRMQQALKTANTLDRLGGGAGDGPGFMAGGYTGAGPRDQPAGIVHADEQVINSPSRRSLEAAKPGALDYMNQTGKWPGYAGGGYVWPFPVNASKTKVPEAPAVPGGGGGPGYKWMEAVIRQAFPGLRVISDFRPGAMTLTGNRSYHGFGRAVDYPASKALAEWINMHYFARTKELITPWNSLNIHNGKRHTYTGAVWNQHNFAGGNAHDHWAMKNGGTITEPIFGVGASGRTYSFGENYQPERVVPNWQPSVAGGSQITITLENHGVMGSRMEVENMLAGALDDLKRKGRI
jgi:TP901 family phage tail tape measure protein